jgi:hypothetical protein
MDMRGPINRESFILTGHGDARVFPKKKRPMEQLARLIVAQGR